MDLLSTAPLLVEQEKIVVIDFGSQYNQLLTRTIREFGVYSEMHPHTTTAEEIKKMNAVGIILSGGPISVADADAYGIDPEIFYGRYSDPWDLLWNTTYREAFRWEV